MERTCPQMPDPTGCLIGVISWWDKIAKIIFSKRAAYYVCKGINNDCLLPEKRQYYYFCCNIKTQPNFSPIVGNSIVKLAKLMLKLFLMSSQVKRLSMPSFLASVVQDSVKIHHLALARTKSPSVENLFKFSCLQPLNLCLQMRHL